MPDWNSTLSLVQALTDRVGMQLLADFGHAQGMEKADGSLVTQSDQWADAELRQAIAQAFPHHGVLSEETVHIFPDNDWCWVIDPLDGTTNFTRGLPLWGISLGLLYQGTPVFGFVHLPPLQQSFYGWWAGNSGLPMPLGAYCIQSGTDRRLYTRHEPPGPNQFFNLCARSLAVLQQPIPCKIRMLGIATYNLLTIASGAVLAGIEATPKIWDIAAVWAIVQAAGGVWVPLQPKPIFPLQPGDNYGDRAYPTLVVSHAGLVPMFYPLVQAIATPGAIMPTEFTLP